MEAIRKTKSLIYYQQSWQNVIVASWVIDDLYEIFKANSDFSLKLKSKSFAHACNFHRV